MDQGVDPLRHGGTGKPRTQREFRAGARLAVPKQLEEIAGAGETAAISTKVPLA